MSEPKPPPAPEDDVPSGLEAAREKLMSESTSSFDVEKILAENRIREEHKKEAHKSAMQKLDTELAAARQRGAKVRAQKLEAQRVQYQKAQTREFDAQRHALEAEKSRLAAQMKQMPKQEKL